MSHYITHKIKSDRICDGLLTNFRFKLLPIPILLYAITDQIGNGDTTVGHDGDRAGSFQPDGQLRRCESNSTI